MRAGSNLDSLSAFQDVPPQAPVAHEAEQRVLERRRFVVLEKEMANPGERVALNERCSDKPPALRDRGSDQQCEGDARAREVQPAASAIDVLAEIEGIEIAETAVCGLVVHGKSVYRVFI